jgi:predicted RNA binding protein YcfA (HicA-like mRNA interferase family)
MSGEDLAWRLHRRYGYQFVRQRGSHMMVVLAIGGVKHSVTVPRHRAMRVGTLNGIVSDVAVHLGITKDEVRSELFGS